MTKVEKILGKFHQHSAGAHKPKPCSWADTTFMIGEWALNEEKTLADCKSYSSDLFEYTGNSNLNRRLNQNYHKNTAPLTISLLRERLKYELYRHVE